MTELNQRQRKFYNKWKVQRTNKFKYMFVHGSIYWGLPTAVILYIIEQGFDVNDIKLGKLIAKLVFTLAFGLLYGHFQFKNNERLFSSYKKDYNRTK